MMRWAAALAAMVTMAAVLAVAPAGAQEEPAPVISVTPNVGLLDGQQVVVKAARFTPNAGAAAAFCGAAVLDSVSLDDCTFSGARVFDMSPAGRAQVTMSAHRVLQTPNGEVDCSRARACILGVATGEFPVAGAADLTDLEFAWRYLRFQSGPPPMVTDVRVAEVTTEFVRATVTCSGPSLLTAEVTVESLGPGAEAMGRSISGLHCVGERTVTLPLTERIGRFRNGPVAVRLDLEGSGTSASTEFVGFVPGDRWYTEPALLHGDRLRVRVKKVRVDGDDLRVRVTGRCPRPMSTVIFVQAYQLVPGDSVQADGNRSVTCDGPLDATLTLRPLNVFLAQGRLNVRVAAIESVPTGTASALAVAPAVLDRPVRPPRWLVPSQPDGPTTVGRPEPTTIPLTVDCSGPVAVMNIRVLHRVGRELKTTRADTAVPCNTPAAAEPNQPLPPGPVVIKVDTFADGETTEQVVRRKVG